jgi:hypothetical protein
MHSALLHTSLFLAGLASAAAAIRSVDALPFWSWTKGKVAHVAAGADGCDTLFLGSSRIHYGLQPDAFDRRMAELGQPTKSFNLAFCGMRQHDVCALLEWLAAHKPPTLRRVIVELHGWDQRIRGGGWMTDMPIEMHTLAQAAPRLRSVLLSSCSALDKAQQHLFVAAHTAANALRIGQGTRILDALLGRSKPQVLDKKTRAWRGWRPACPESDSSPQAMKDHATFLGDPARFAAVADEKAKDPRRAFLAGGFNLSACTDMVQRAKAAGLDVVFVVMPTMGHDFRGRDGVDAAAKLAPVVELDRFGRHAELADLALYYDASHLNAAGAELASRILAEETARILNPEAPLALTAQWSATTPPQLVVRVRNMPPHGEAFVGLAAETAELALAGDVVLGIALPPIVVQPLLRQGDGAAEARIDWSAAPLHERIYAQVCVLQGTTPTQASAVLAVDPPERRLLGSDR